MFYRTNVEIIRTDDKLQARNDLSQAFLNLLEGLDKPGDCANDPSIPHWLNKELFETGKQFYNKYMFSIVFSELLGLLPSFSNERLLIPLIYTKMSDTPSKALRRYFSTVRHVVSWFQNDIWDPQNEGYKDLMNIRNIHKVISQRVNSEEEIAARFIHREDGAVNLCSFSKFIQQDSSEEKRSVREYGSVGLCLFSEYIQQDLEKLLGIDISYTGKYFSQLDMALIQYSFMGLVIAHPRMMGLWWVTNKELEGFIHFWKGVGWLLGIEDKYNLCNGSLDDVKSMCLEIEKHIVLPNFSKASKECEEMSEALMKGINRVIPGVSFPSMLLYLVTTIDVKSTCLRKNIKWRNYCQYLLMRFVFNCLLIIPCIMPMFNYLVRLALRLSAPRLGLNNYNRKI